MKSTNCKVIIPIFLLLFVATLHSCQPKDTTIKTDLTIKAKEKKEFAGVRFIVDKGMVTLHGECATEEAKNTVEKTVKQTYGVHQVVNNLTIAPVVLGTDQLLKQGIDSIMMQYPTLEAITKDSIVYLQGKLPDADVIKLKDAINSLKPKMVNAELSSK